MDGNTNNWVVLPPDLFTNYDSISLECWFVDEGSRLGTYLMRFYGNAGISGSNISYFVNGYTVLSSQSESAKLYTSPSIPQITNHLVLTQDNASRTVRLYLNDLIIGQQTNTGEPG